MKKKQWRRILSLLCVALLTVGAWPQPTEAAAPSDKDWYRLKGWLNTEVQLGSLELKQDGIYVYLNINLKNEVWAASPTTRQNAKQFQHANAKPSVPNSIRGLTLVSTNHGVGDDSQHQNWQYKYRIDDLTRSTTISVTVPVTFYAENWRQSGSSYIWNGQTAKTDSRSVSITTSTSEFPKHTITENYIEYSTGTVIKTKTTTSVVTTADYRKTPPAITHYTYYGWNTTGHKTNVQSTGNPSINGVGSNQNVYMVYKKNNYALTYQGNGGNTNVRDNKSPYAAQSKVTVLPGNGGTQNYKTERQNHEFTGWNTAADGSGTSYQPGETFTITAPTTLYAQWVEKAGLEVTKTEDQTTVAPGKAATFTITVKNVSSGILTGIQVIDSMADSRLSLKDSVSGISINENRATIDRLGSGESVTFQSRVVVPETAAHGQVITNKVTVSDDQGNREESQASVTVRHSLGITKSADTQIACPGDTVRYTVTLQNISGRDQKRVILRDSLSPLINFKATTDLGGRLTIRGNMAVLSSMKKDEAIVFQYDYVIPESYRGTVLDNTVSVQDDGGSVFRASCSTEVTKPLSLKKTTDGMVRGGLPGDIVTYIITLKNEDRSRAITDILLTDTLDPEEQWHTESTAVTSIEGNRMTISRLEPGETITVTYPYKIPDNGEGFLIENRAEASGTQEGTGKTVTAEGRWYLKQGTDPADIPARSVTAPPIRGTRGEPITPVQVTQDGGSPNGTWRIENLPPGLTYDPETGVISGTPSAHDIGLYTATYITKEDGLETSGEGEKNISDEIRITDPPVSIEGFPLMKILRVGDTGETDLKYSGKTTFEKELKGLEYIDKTPLTADEIRSLSVAYADYEDREEGYGFGKADIYSSTAFVDVSGGKIHIRAGASGITKVTLSLPEGQTVDFVVLVPGDIDLNGAVEDADAGLCKRIRRMEDSELAYPYQRLMADMDSDEISDPTVNSRDTGIIVHMVTNLLIPSN